MKRLISAILASLMLLGAAPAAFAAEGEPPLSLTADSHLFLDTEKGYVDGIDGTVTVADLKANFATSVTVKTGDTEKADDKFVATDDVISAGTDSLRALIYGDVDRTGKINLTDVSVTMKYIAKWNTDMNTDAADVDKSGAVNLLDASKLLKSIAGFEDISLGNVRLVFDNTKITAENESSALDLYFGTPLIKIAQSNTKSTGEHAYKISLARNETESCQFFVTSDADMEGLVAELSDFEHEYGEGTLSGELFIHYYYEFEVQTNTLGAAEDKIVEYDKFVEPLLPYSGSFEVKADKNQGFHISVTAGKDTPAGMYKATLTLKDSSGKEVKRANVYVNVWDFTLPDTPYSKSSFGMSGYGIYATLGRLDKKWYNGDDHYTHARYYEMLLDHNVSAYQLPYDITDDRADALMSDPRVTSFEICGENLRLPEEDDKEGVLERWAKVQTNPVWAEKGHFYYVDEPYESGHQLIKHQHEYLTELLGTDDFDIILPFFNSMADRVNNIDMLAFIEPYVDIFVPRSDGFHANTETHFGRSPWTPRQAFNKYGENLPRLQALKDDPEHELWWYVCIDPPFPYPNLFTTQQGNMNRVIWWQQFIFDTEGFLYWATQAGWDSVYDKRGGGPGLGDGLLMYIGEMYGLEGPVASWRLIQVRDGFDDFDYLKMAEEVCGREAVLNVVRTLTTDVVEVNEDPDVMESCRNTIAKMILEAQEK